MTTEKLDRDGVERRAAARGRREVKETEGKLGQLKVEYVPTDSVKPNAYNPNRQDPREWELLLNSMRQNGFTRPVLVDRASGEIVDGEHRWRAARHFELAEIPVVFVNWDEVKRMTSTLRHNRAHGSEDADLTAQLFRDLRELGALDLAREQLALSDEDLRRMIDDVKAPGDLASEEFSEAWAPTRNVEPGATTQGDAVSMTPESELAQREAKEKLRRAKTDEERRTAEAEARRQTLRVVATFDGEGAALVRRVLGLEKPAARLLELARADAQAKAAAARQEDFDAPQ